MRDVESVLTEARRIEGWMREEELRWLAMMAMGRTRIVEVGSWKGRSTKALAGMTPGRVFAVDHFGGSMGELSTFHQEAAVNGAESIYIQFCDNLAVEIASGACVPVRIPSGTAARLLGAFLRPDFVFIDAGHMYDEVHEDILAWQRVMGPKALMAGHDFGGDVERAVRSVFGDRAMRGPESLWYVMT